MQDLRATYDSLKIEYDELCNISKLKRTSPQAYAQYVARLRRLREACTNSIDLVPDEGPKQVTGTAVVKAQRKLLKSLIEELENIDEVIQMRSVQLAELKQEIKKTTVNKGHQFHSVPPDEK